MYSGFCLRKTNNLISEGGYNNPLLFSTELLLLHLLRENFRPIWELRPIITFRIRCFSRPGHVWNTWNTHGIPGLRAVSQFSQCFLNWSCSLSRNHQLAKHSGNSFADQRGGIGLTSSLPIFVHTCLININFRVVFHLKRTRTQFQVILTLLTANRTLWNRNSNGEHSTVLSDESTYL